MHHHALHLSFTSALQIAASRAWTRCLPIPRIHDLAVRPPTRPSCTRTCISPTIPAAPIVDCHTGQGIRCLNPRMQKQRTVVDIDPNDLTDDDMFFVDPGRSDIEGNRFSNVTETGTAVSLLIRKNSVLPPSRSKNSLHQNLLYLINQCDPVPSFPALVDYHDMHPEFQSTRSYNLLIDLALRHAAIGTVQWLFRSMKASGITPNLETWKLQVRWFARIRRWDQVLKIIKKFQPDSGRHRYLLAKDWQPKCSRQNIPLPIWLELFPPTRRGSVRPRARSDDVRKGATEAQRLNDAAQAFCYQLLMEIKPLIVPELLADLPPRLLYHLIRILFQSGDNATAHSLTISYLTNLPRKLAHRKARSCLELIHLNLLHASSLEGLPRFYEVRRTLFSLLKLHPDLRPTSSTLLLLLAPLRAAKRCGTIAWKVVRSLQSHFGLKIVDSRIRRKIVMLANKEGRMDIVDKVAPWQETVLFARRTWKLERAVLGGIEPSLYRKLCRAPHRKVYRHNGKEQRTWRLLNRRILSRRIAQQWHE